MAIWTVEIKELEKLYESLKGQLPELEKELEQLIRTEDANVIMLYSRRSLEIIITDLCECELKRPRKTEPLQGIIDKLNKEEKVPYHIIASMHGLNTLATFGTHPKDFDPEQVKPVLNNLYIIIKWYLKYKDIIGTDIKVKPLEGIKQKRKNTEDVKKSMTISRKRFAALLSGLIAIFVTVFAVLFIAKIIGGGKQTKELERSIAVLPFINDSPSDSNQYFINGVMEEVLINLQKIKDLIVISRTSVEQFRNTPKSIPEIAKELGVNYIVEGSGQKYGSTFSLRVQLIKAAKENHLWAESYKQEIKNVSDIYSIQSKIAQKITAELKATITPDVKQQIEKQPTDNLEAYTLYTIGNYLMLQQTEDAFRKAMDNYKQAISLDSSFAMAYAGLASSYLELGSWMVPSPSSEFISKARDFASKALEINNNLAEAYFVIGTIKYIHEWDWNGAERAFKKGMELNPNYVYGRIGYANFLTAMGRFEESIVIGQQTLKLSPLDPTVYNELAFAMFFNGQDEKALELYNESLDINPSFDQTLCVMVMLYARKGQYDQAISIWQKELKLFDYEIRKIPAFDLGFAGQVFGLAGRRNEALTLLQELNRRAVEEGYIPTSYMAFIYIGLGENQKALELLEKGFNDKDFVLVWLKVHSMFDPLRSNEQFKQLLKKMRFTE